MSKIHYSTALIVGAGGGISASLARLFAQRGLKVAVAARDAEKLGPLTAEIGGAAFATDAGDAVQVKQLFEDVARTVGEPDVVVYNASGRVRGALVDLDPAEVVRRRSALRVERLTSRSACSIRMRSPRLTGKYSNSLAAPGHGRSSYAPGSKLFEEMANDRFVLLANAKRKKGDDFS